MALTINRKTLSTILSRRCLLQSSMKRLYLSDDKGSNDKNADLQSLLNKMKNTDQKEKQFSLKAKPIKKVLPDYSSSSSSSDSSDSDEEPLDVETDIITEKVAAHKAKEANLDASQTFALKNSVKKDLTAQLRAMRKETKSARKESEVSGTGDSMEQLVGSMKVLKQTISLKCT